MFHKFINSYLRMFCKRLIYLSFRLLFGQCIRRFIVVLLLFVGHLLHWVMGKHITWRNEGRFMSASLSSRNSTVSVQLPLSVTSVLLYILWYQIFPGTNAFNNCLIHKTPEIHTLFKAMFYLASLSPMSFPVIPICLGSYAN